MGATVTPSVSTIPGRTPGISTAISIWPRAEAFCYDEREKQFQHFRSGNISGSIAHNQDKFQNGIILFNSGEFFKAHEAWEEIWLVAPPDEKLFLQGLIQLAAAFHHYSRGNRSGAQSLAAAALEKLEKCPEAFGGVNLEALRGAARSWLNAPRNRPACVPVPTPKIQPIKSY